MVYIDKIAYNLNRRDEAPNQELAKELVESNNIEGFDEIASYLYEKTNQ